MKNLLLVLSISSVFAACVSPLDKEITGRLDVKQNSHLQLIEKNGNICQLDSGNYTLSVSPSDEKENEISVRVSGTQSCELRLNIMPGGTDKFFSSVSNNGQKYSIAGYSSKNQLSHTEVSGTAKCSGIGYCHQYDLADGEYKWGTYMNCPGTKGVIYNVDVYRSQYHFLFQSHARGVASGAFSSTPEDSKQETIKEVTTSCHVGISVGIGPGIKL